MAIKLHDLAMKCLKDRHNNLQKKLEKSCASISDAFALLTEASTAIKEEIESALNVLRALLPPSKPVDSELELSSADPSVPVADSESKMKSKQSSSDPSPDPPLLWVVLRRMRRPTLPMLRRSCNLCSIPTPTSTMTLSNFLIV
nr:hypothetical protein Iba_scaffold16392CG0320 [Ipomoea batatas]